MKSIKFSDDNYVIGTREQDQKPFIQDFFLGLEINKSTPTPTAPTSTAQQAANTAIEVNETQAQNASAFRLTEPVSKLSGFAIGFDQSDFVGNFKQADNELVGALVAAGFTSSESGAIASDVAKAGTGSNYISPVRTTADTSSNWAADAALNNILAADPNVTAAHNTVAAINAVLKSNAAAQTSITNSSNANLVTAWGTLTTNYFSPTASQPLWAPFNSLMLGGTTAFQIAAQIMLADYNNQYGANLNGPMWNLWYHGSGQFGPTGSAAPPPVTLAANASPQAVVEAVAQAMLTTLQASQTFAAQAARLQEDLNQANVAAASAGLPLLPTMSFTSPYGSVVFVPAGTSSSFHGNDNVDGGNGLLNNFSGTLTPTALQWSETTNNADGSSTNNQYDTSNQYFDTQTNYSGANGTGTPTPVDVVGSRNVTGPGYLTTTTEYLPDGTTIVTHGTFVDYVLPYNDSLTDYGTTDQISLIGPGSTVTASNEQISENWGGLGFPSGTNSVIGSHDTILEATGTWLNLNGTASDVSALGNSGQIAIDLLAASSYVNVHSAATLFFSGNNQSIDASSGDVFMDANGGPLSGVTDYVNGNSDYIDVGPSDTMVLTGSGDTYDGSGDDVIENIGNSAALDLDTGTLATGDIVYYDNTGTGGSQSISFNQASGASEVLQNTSGSNGAGAWQSYIDWYNNGSQTQGNASAPPISNGPDGSGGWAPTVVVVQDSRIQGTPAGSHGDAAGASSTSGSSYLELTSETFTLSKAGTVYNVAISYNYSSDVLKSEVQTVRNTAGATLGTTTFNASGGVISTSGTAYPLMLPTIPTLHIYGGGQGGVKAQAMAHPADGNTGDGMLDVADLAPMTTPDTLAGIAQMAQTPIGGPGAGQSPAGRHSATSMRAGALMFVRASVAMDTKVQTDDMTNDLRLGHMDAGDFMSLPRSPTESGDFLGRASVSSHGLSMLGADWAAAAWGAHVPGPHPFPGWHPA